MVEGSYYCTMECNNPFMHLMHEGVVELYEQDNQLKGTMIGTFFWIPSNFVGGKVDGDEFEFDAFFNTPCQAYTLHVKGCVKGDDLEGTAESTMGQFVLKGYRVQDSYRAARTEVGSVHTFQRSLAERKQRI